MILFSFFFIIRSQNAKNYSGRHSVETLRMHPSYLEYKYTYFYNTLLFIACIYRNCRPDGIVLEFFMKTQITKTSKCRYNMPDLISFCQYKYYILWKYVYLSIFMIKVIKVLLKNIFDELTKIFKSLERKD